MDCLNCLNLFLCKDLINLIKEFAKPNILPWFNEPYRTDCKYRTPVFSPILQPLDYLESWYETDILLEPKSFATLYVPRRKGKVNCIMIRTPFIMDEVETPYVTMEEARRVQPAFELGIYPNFGYPKEPGLPFNMGNLRRWFYYDHPYYHVGSWRWNLDGMLFPNISGDRDPFIVYVHQSTPLKLRVMFGWLNPDINLKLNSGAKPIYIGCGLGCVMEDPFCRMMMSTP